MGFVAADDPPPDHDAIHVCPAFVDTGASHTCISQAVAEALRLEPAGKTEMRTAKGAVAVNVYDVRLIILFPAAKQGPGGEQTGAMQAFNPIRAPQFEPGDQTCMALIGRDILSQDILQMSFDGHYTFSF